MCTYIYIYRAAELRGETTVVTPIIHNIDPQEKRRDKRY